MKYWLCLIFLSLSLVNKVSSQLKDFFLELPQDNVRNVQFFLFHNPWERDTAQEIKLDGKIGNLKYHPNSQWKILIHGFTQNLHSNTFPQNVKNGYLKRFRKTNETWNVLVVDWGKLAYHTELNPVFMLPVYRRAVRNVIPTGERIGQFISFLMEKKIINNLNAVHLIGFSLGAHVAGVAAEWLKNEYKEQTIHRITGIDPAGPLFHNNDTSRQLKSSDASFVDVYKCNPGGLGTDLRLGMVEFYINMRDEKDLIQPQCKVLIHQDTEMNNCSHLYCSRIFAWALFNELRAEKCNGRSTRNQTQICDKGNTTLFGNDASFDIEGDYFLDFKDNLDDPKVFY